MNRPCKFNQCRTLARLAGLFGLLFSVASGRALADTTTQPQPLRGPEAFARLLRADELDVDALLNDLNAPTLGEFLQVCEIPQVSDLADSIADAMGPPRLSPAQNERLATINNQLNAAMDTADLKAARAAASEAFDCRSKWLGPDDWQTQWSLRWTLTLQQLADQPPKAWEDFVEFQRLSMQVFNLWKSGDAAGALPIAKRCVRISLLILGENEQSSRALLNLGAQYAKLQDVDRAARCFTAGLVMARRVFPRGNEEIPNFITSLAALVEEKKEPLAAELLNRVAIGEILRLHPNGMELASLSLSLLKVCPSVQRYRNADLNGLNGLLKEADALLPRVHSVRVELLLRIAWASRTHPGQTTAALDALEKARAINKEIGADGLRDQGIVENEMGLLKASMHDPVGASKLFIAASDLFNAAIAHRPSQKKHITLWLVKSMINLSYARESCGDAEGAMKAALKARDSAESGTGWVSLETDVTRRLCVCALTIGRIEECNDYASKLLKRVETLIGRESDEYATAANTVGLAFDQQGRFREAEKLFRDALQVRRRLVAEPPKDNTDPTYQSSALETVLNNLASCLKAAGQFTEAEKVARESIQIETKVTSGTDLGIAVNLNTLADILIDKGDLGAAREVLDVAITVAKSNPSGLSRELAVVYNTMAKLELRAGRQTEAANFFDLYSNTTVSVSQKAGFNTLQNFDQSVFEACLSLNDPVYGEKLWLKKVTSAPTEESSIEPRLWAGDCLARQGTAPKLREACKQFELARLTAASVCGENHPLTVRSAVRLAEARLRLGDNPNVVLELDSALSKAEQLRTSVRGSELDRGLFGETLYLHRTSVDLAAAHLIGAKKDSALAFAALERGSSRAMMDLLSSATGEAPTAENKQLRVAMDDERFARAELDALWRARAEQSRPGPAPTTAPTDNAPSEQLVGARLRMEQSAAKVRELLGERLADAAPATLAAVQALLRKGDVLLSSQINDAFWVTLAVTADHVAFDVSPLADRESKKLRAAMLALRAGVTTPRDAAYKPGPEDQNLLLRWLSPEIRKCILDGNRLIVLDSTALVGCPFDVTAQSLGQPELTKDKVIVYAPSGSFFAHLQSHTHRPPVENSLMAIGDPDFGAMASRAGMPGHGAAVVEVIPNGIADKAGLRVGDVILKFADTSIASPSDLANAVIRAQANRLAGARLTYWRARTPNEAGNQAELTMTANAPIGMTLGSAALAPFLGNLGDTDDSAVAGISQLERNRLFGGVLNPVPVTGGQARAVAKLFGEKRNSTLLLGSDATISNVEQAVAGKRYVLFGSHGLTGTRDRPYDACIALTQPPRASMDDTGYLTLERVLRGWDGKLADCDLVVLSACSTQSGQQVGDSMMALPVGFIHSGCRSVVATLWEVDGVATAVLMKRMFENLLGQYEGKPRAVCNFTAGPDKKLSKALALAEARHWMSELDPEAGRIAAMEATGLPPDQLKLLTLGGTAPTPATGGPTTNRFDFRNPYYWGAFVLVGDPD